MQNIQTVIESERALFHVSPEPENGISEDGLAVSELEYWDKYYNHPDFSYEWNNGILEVKPMSDLRGSRVFQWFQYLLHCYFVTNPIGEIVNLEIGFRLALPDKTSVRKPDMAVVLGDNPMPMDPFDCSYSGTFDLCVESLSYSSSKEIKRDTIVKKGEYEGIGVREYYILDARKIETAFYGLNRRGKYVRIRPSADGVVRSGVLPGFQFRVSDLYSRPTEEKLVEDGVYQEYVFPFHQRVKQKAEQEKLRAEQEKLRAEHAEKKLALERQRAERLAAKLEALGISSE